MQRLTNIPTNGAAAGAGRGGTGAAGRAAPPRVTAVGRLPRESCPRRVASNWLLVARSRGTGVPAAVTKTQPY